MNIEVTLLFIVASVNCLLSLFVLFGKRDKINIIYSIFVLFASFWAIGLAYFIMETDLSRSLYIANLYYIAAAGIPAFFLFFSTFFLNPNQNINKLHQFIIVLPLLLLSVTLIFDKNFILKEVFDTSWGKDVVINIINYIIYSVYFILFVILAYFRLISTLLTTKNSEEKSQLKFILWGTLIGFIFGMIFDLFLPFFGDYKHIYIGPIFSFTMVAAIAYSITKFHLFNMKVIVTEILMFLLWVFIFIRTIVSNTLEDQIVNGSMLFISVFVGIFLIRSVIREVRQREQIEKLAADLKIANEGQASLMHFMNHQVKGRLGNAKNIFAELLTNDYGEVPDFAKPFLEKGLEETKMGVDYVQNILKGASAENGTLPFDMKPMDFKSVVEEVAEKQKEQVEKKDLEFKLNIKDGDYNITGDKVELGEAVRNLIDNSKNYTESGSIEVNLKNVGKNVQFSVKDTGVGLTEDDKIKLFKSGGRGAESVRVNVNSTGYGLVFVKGVIEAHKGRVWAESAGRGQGSTFIIELPKT